jgi:hypothetical protein
VKIAEVKWGDAWIDTCDMPLIQAKKLKAIVRYTVGYLIADTADSIILCTDYFDKDKTMINAPMLIPKGMVIGYWLYDITKEKLSETKRSNPTGV